MTGTQNELEEGNQLKLDFRKISNVAKCAQDVVPVVVQDIASQEVLLIGYANLEALDYTVAHKVAAFWSTSRNELWVKGATSGEYLDLKEIRVNCEQNSLLYLVAIRNLGACHTNQADGTPRLSCYYRKLDSMSELSFVDEPLK